MSTINKVFKVLEACSSLESEASINQISQMTGFPRSTVHRILSMLIDEGIVTLQKGYKLTPKLLSIGLSGLGQKNMLDESIPVMRDLVEITGETVSMNVICGYERVCIYRIEGKDQLLRIIKIGGKSPLHKGAAGKVLVAGMGESQLNNLMQYLSSEKCFNTNKFREEIDLIRNQGYAVSVGELGYGAAAIAVPVKDFAGITLASMSLSFLDVKFDKTIDKNLIRTMLDFADAISKRIGYQGSF